MVTNKEINYEKHLVIGTINTIDKFSLLKKINNKDMKINTNSTDIFYNYKNNNNAIDKKNETI